MVFGRCLQKRDVELYSACQEAVRHTQEQNAVLVAESQRYYQALRVFFTAETEASIIAPLAVLLGFIPAAGNYRECSAAELENLQVENDGALCSFLAPAFFENAVGLRLVRGTRLPFPADGPSCKYAALFDLRPAFDALRDAFVKESPEFRLLLGDVLGPVEDDETQGVVLSFLDVWDEYEHCKCRAEPPPDFASRAWLAYTDALMSGQYFLSVDELLLICECATVNVVVFQQIGAHLLVAGHSLRTAAPPVLVKLRGSGSRRVRTHFERLVPQTSCLAPPSRLVGVQHPGTTAEPKTGPPAEPASESAVCGADGEANIAEGLATSSSDQNGCPESARADKNLGGEASDVLAEDAAPASDEGVEASSEECDAVSSEKISSSDIASSSSKSDTSSDDDAMSDVVLEEAPARVDLGEGEATLEGSLTEESLRQAAAQHEGNEEDEECFSDISNNSDIFHVEAIVTESPRTREDEDLGRIDRLRAHMRSFPFLPPDPNDAQESFMDVKSGVQLPDVHCAFRGCKWTASVPQLSHWAQEKALYTHLLSSHRDAECKEVLEYIGEQLKLERRADYPDPLLRVVAYDLQARCEQEILHMPMTGASVDRRSLTGACRAAQSNTVRSLICFGCAQQYTSVKCWETLCHESTWHSHQKSFADIRMLRVADSLLLLEGRDPEMLASWFSMDVFRRRYARDDAASGNPFQSGGPWEGAHWEWRRELLIPAKEWLRKVS